MESHQVIILEECHLEKTNFNGFCAGADSHATLEAWVLARESKPGHVAIEIGRTEEGLIR